MILALETATDICSISFQDSEGNIHEKKMKRKGSHSEYVFLFIRELMEEFNFNIRDLEAVLVSNGPGSYTGLRIAASAVKGLLFGENIDVYAANTLAGFAASISGNSSLMHSVTQKAKDSQFNIHAVINARRSHLYHQSFTFDTILKAVDKPAIIEIAEVEQQINIGDAIIGTGINRLGDKSLEGCHIFDSEEITANALISLFNSDARNSFFIKTTAEELESNYISSSQINNSSIN